MSFRKSIRWRIQSWHGLLLLAVIAGFGVMTYRLQSSNAWRRADSELEVRLGALTGELGRGGGGRPPPYPGEEQEGPRPGFRAPELAGIFDPKEESPMQGMTIRFDDADTITMGCKTIIGGKETPDRTT